MYYYTAPSAPITREQITILKNADKLGLYFANPNRALDQKERPNGPMGHITAWRTIKSAGYESEASVNIETGARIESFATFIDGVNDGDGGRVDIDVMRDNVDAYAYVSTAQMSERLKTMLYVVRPGDLVWLMFQRGGGDNGHVKDAGLCSDVTYIVLERKQGSDRSGITTLRLTFEIDATTTRPGSTRTVRTERERSY